MMFVLLVHNVFVALYYCMQKNKFNIMKRFLSTLLILCALSCMQSALGAVEAEPFQDKKGRWGYKSSEGKVLYAAKLDRIEPFVDGAAIVSSKDKYGVMSSSGSLLLPLVYSDVQRDAANTFRVATGGKRSDGGALTGAKWGVFSSDGGVIVPVKFKFIEPLSIGRGEDAEVLGFVVCNYMTTSTIIPFYKKGFYNLKGREVIKPGSCIRATFHDDKTIVVGYKVLSQSLIDIDGNILVPTGKYSFISEPEDGVAIVKMADKKNFDYYAYHFDSGEKYQLTTTGSLVVGDTDGGKSPIRPHDGVVFIVSTATTSSVAYKTVKGELLMGDFFPFKNFSEGLAVVTKDGLYGAINRQGEVVVECKYKEMESAKDGLMKVRSSDNKLGYVSVETHQEVVPAIYDMLLMMSDGYAVAVKNGVGVGCIDANNNTIVDFKWRQIVRSYTPGVKSLWVKDRSSGERFVIDIQSGEAVNDNVYDEDLSPQLLVGTKYIVKKNGYFGVVDIDGEECVPFVIKDEKGDENAVSKEVISDMNILLDYSLSQDDVLTEIDCVRHLRRQKNLSEMFLIGVVIDDNRWDY